MPNGEFNASMKTVFVSATPSPSASRSSTMRLAVGAPAPAFFCTDFITLPLSPLASSGLGGALVSATSTSPLGSTNSQRGWLRFVANALTATPAGAAGFSSAGQPLAGATCIVGITCLSTGLMTGCGPTVSGGEATGPVLLSPGIAWADSAAAAAAETARTVDRRDITAPGGLRAQRSP